MRVLVVEDEDKMRAVLQRGLRAAGYAVDSVADGGEGLARAVSGDYDALVVDIVLPGIDGFDLCRALRRAEIWTPVLLLTALGDVEDRITGLDAGADDYVTKPFAFEELLSRLRALIRRGRPPRPTALTRGELTLDPATRMVTWAGTPIELTSREFALLEYLMHHAGEVVQRSTIRRHVWGANSDERSSNTIDAYVKNLRDKIDRRFDAEVIETIRGVGYRLRPLSAE
ncbi:MAG: response regulator transcription factor [Acidobacteria bacterium]|jgi:DNA-binding response OmpR family regulator|nr:response regulator transcription factor [Acidobacteriota bacterium]